MLHFVVRGLALVIVDVIFSLRDHWFLFRVVCWLLWWWLNRLRDACVEEGRREKKFQSKREGEGFVYMGSTHAGSCGFMRVLIRVQNPPHFFGPKSSSCVESNHEQSSVFPQRTSPKKDSGTS